jgi:hypothetical protein
VPILSQLVPVHTPTSKFLKTHARETTSDNKLITTKNVALVVFYTGQKVSSKHNGSASNEEHL